MWAWLINWDEKDQSNKNKAFYKEWIRWQEMFHLIFMETEDNYKKPSTNELMAKR